MLVALGVIFIPMILSGGRDEMPIFGSNIPDKPRAIKNLKSLEFPTPPKIAIDDQEIRIPVKEGLPPARDESPKLLVQQQDKPKSGKQRRAEAEQPSAQAPAGTQAWVVQLGSFSKRANALALEKKLRRHKFAAFVELVKTKKGAIYRVRVGPEVKRDKAEQQLKAIRKKLKINGVVMSHP